MCRAGEHLEEHALDSAEFSKLHQEGLHQHPPTVLDEIPNATKQGPEKFSFRAVGLLARKSASKDKAQQSTAELQITLVGDPAWETYTNRALGFPNLVAWAPCWHGCGGHRGLAPSVPSTSKLPLQMKTSALHDCIMIEGHPPLPHPLKKMSKNDKENTLLISSNS